jgi:molybdenum cofactor cytidylyltransferase
MKFLSAPPLQASGCILAHSIFANGNRMQKGKILSQQDCVSLAGAGVTEIWIVKLESDDVDEDTVATRIAQSISGIEKLAVRIGSANTGRCNIYATDTGICLFDANAIQQLNLLAEEITVSTVAEFAPVRANQMIATIKVIPFAVRESVVSQIEKIGGEVGLRVGIFKKKNARLIMTRISGIKESLFEKALTVTAARLADVNFTIETSVILPHSINMVAEEIAQDTSDMTLILGGSAISDRADVVPSAILKAGGEIIRLGMPVDPGNLLCLARHADGRPIIGLPGCARSPKLNGFDLVLYRLAAGLEIKSADIARMGVGGLLEELPERGQLRESEVFAATGASSQKVGAVLLAAGQSSRMGKNNKLLLQTGQMTVVQRAAKNLLDAGINDIVVVTGRDAEQVGQSLGAPITVHNPAFAEGISTSIKAGIAAIPDSWESALIVLGDMPSINPDTIRKLIAAASKNCDAVVPIFEGKQGHPVLWKRPAISLLQQAHGDVGGKAVLAQMGDRVLKISVDDPGILIDIDTPEAWRAFRDQS